VVSDQPDNAGDSDGADAAASVVAPIPLPAEGHGGVIRGYGEFELDVELVLREKLPVFFEALEQTPLTLENVGALPERSKGAYMLFRGDDPRPVYAGKTDTTHGFRDRLARHAWTVQGRQNLDPAQMRFKAVRILVFAALDVEAILIREMRTRMPGSLSWNNSGFGSNDPGRNRDGQRPANFDQEFPVDIEFTIPDFPTAALTIPDALDALKQRIPYLLRHGGLPADRAMPEVSGAMTVRSLLNAAMGALPPGFQATVLHGRVVIYQERRDYPFMLEAIRS
jgi:hypothetical protein